MSSSILTLILGLSSFGKHLWDRYLLLKSLLGRFPSFAIYVERYAKSGPTPSFVLVNVFFSKHNKTLSLIFSQIMFLATTCNFKLGIVLAFTIVIKMHDKFGMHEYNY